MYDLQILFGLYLYIAWCIVNTLIAQAKRRSAWQTLLASVLFTPLLAWLYIAFVPAQPPRP